jgi:2-desacetyl-2-hydroxyethyl bacteriochlorophyllide A dehydrogenase
MKAVVVERPHQVSYREVGEPAVGADDVLVASREAGLCRTDIEVMTGIFTDPRWVHFPVIPGHEWAGTVVEVGANVESLHAGDRVVCEGLIGCHRCAPCRRGETHWCERIEALGFTRPGGYAELVTVPARVVHRLADHVSFDAGVLIEPASVVLHGLEKARPQPGETAGVIGIGTLGSLAIALLRLHSPARLVAYGIREAELELATALGASEVVQVGGGPPGAGPPGAGPPGGAPPAAAELDLVVDTSGSPSAIALASEICRPGGRALLLGLAGEGRSLTLPSDLLTGKDMTLIGSLAYPASVWSRVVGLVSDRVLTLEPIVTHRFPAAEFEEAVRLMDNRDGVVAKIVLEHT